MYGNKLDVRTSRGDELREYFIINNISLEKESYEINKYIVLKKHESNKTCVYIDEESSNKWEANYRLFFDALLVAIPEIHLEITYRSQLQSESDRIYLLYRQEIIDLNSPMFNYYYPGNSEFNCSKICIEEKDIEKIKVAFEIIIKCNKNIIEGKTDRLDRWFIAYNSYLNSYNSLSVELSVQNMITLLETLLVDGASELSFKVSLYTSLIEGKSIKERKDIFNLVKYMYDIRSKSVHGDIKSSKKKLINFDYDRYYNFKRIVSNILLKTYSMDEKKIFEVLEEMLYTANEFDSYVNIR